MINLSTVRDLTFELVNKGKYYSLVPSRHLRVETKEELLVRIQKTNQFVFVVLDDFDKQIRNLKGELLAAKIAIFVLSAGMIIERIWR